MRAYAWFVGVGALLVVLSIIPHVVFSQAPSSEIFAYETTYSSSGMLHFVMLKNGDVYLRSYTYHIPWNAAGLMYLGNWWGSMQPRTDMVEYIVVGSSMEPVQQFLIMSNGDTYTRDDQFLYAGNPFYIGNYWGNPIATGKSSWGNLKENFRK